MAIAMQNERTAKKCFASDLGLVVVVSANRSSRYRFYRPCDAQELSISVGRTSGRGRVKTAGYLKTEMEV
jgi:hypothetical protein